MVNQWLLIVITFVVEMIELFDHSMLPLVIGSETHVEIETGGEQYIMIIHT